MPILKVGDRKAPSIPRKLAGFSLLEAVLVMVVVGLVAALVMPAFASSYRSAVLKSTVRSTAANLRYVRASAIGAGSKKVLAFDPEARVLSILPASSDPSNLQRQAIAPYIDVSEAKARSAVPADRIKAIRFEFSPSGSSNGGNLLFAYKNHRYLIEVSPLTGKVKVSVPATLAHNDNLPGMEK